MKRLLLAALLAVAPASPGFAQQSEETPAAPAEPLPPIYEDDMLRLAEVLGSLTFLRPLCGETDGAAWREAMTELLAAEDPPPQRRARLVGRFNHGYETFAAVYRACTPSARRAIALYIADGERISADLRSRYSQ